MTDACLALPMETSLTTGHRSRVESIGSMSSLPSRTSRGGSRESIGSSNKQCSAGEARQRIHDSNTLLVKAGEAGEHESIGSALGESSNTQQTGTYKTGTYKRSKLITRLGR